MTDTAIIYQATFGNSPVARGRESAQQQGHWRNPCSSSPCFNNGTRQAGYTDKGFRCKCPSGFTGVYCKKACSFDFENGIGGWEMTGRAFIYQPTFGDNPVARERESAQQQGHWWIGGAEKRSNESDPAGKQHPAGADPPNGTLTSPCFRIVGKNISFLIGGGCTVSEIRAELIVNSQNPCSSSPCFNNGTCQAGYTYKGFRCKCPLGFTGIYCKKACSFDFEDGIGGWKMTGTAFIYQPTFGDNPVARGRESAQLQGYWWVGEAEKRPKENDPAGWQHPDGADVPNGTLTSPCFRIVGKNISFLIGGGCDLSKVRAELIVDNQVVRKETGNCSETMYPKNWEVEEFIGQYAKVRLVDETDCCWGHINFDDLKGDIICPHDLDEKN
ncbi:hypothetical protein AWC38_SpisGene16927 [Stylophora pistillata]|uniref:EGF-like domain-containing protein n=1 Tax=Stylophora pistillata TaxID=50429 RepID=A0A2B4RQS6_STYPI|nr:hypothetical protein AWC38_SpisGene16927 [Stylophora pistillata]